LSQGPEGVGGIVSGAAVVVVVVTGGGTVEFAEQVPSNLGH